MSSLKGNAQALVIKTIGIPIYQRTQWKNRHSKHKHYEGIWFRFSLIGQIQKLRQWINLQKPTNLLDT